MAEGVNFGRYNVPEEERINFLDKAARINQEQYYATGIQNEKREIGTFGIIGSDGREFRVKWVRSSLARKIVQDAPAPQSDWMKYQLETMFKGWKDPVEEVLTDATT